MKYMGVFRLVGSFTWNEEAAGSNPVSYTYGLSCSKAGEKHLQCFCEEFDSLTGPHLIC